MSPYTFLPFDETSSTQKLRTQWTPGERSIGVERQIKIYSTRELQKDSREYIRIGARIEHTFIPAGLSLRHAPSAGGLKAGHCQDQPLVVSLSSEDTRLNSRGLWLSEGLTTVTTVSVIYFKMAFLAEPDLTSADA